MSISILGDRFNVGDVHSTCFVSETDCVVRNVHFSVFFFFEVMTLIFGRK